MTNASESAHHDGSVIDVAVVVVTYNSADVIDGFFESLAGGMKGAGSYVVAVSDNASADDSLERVRTRAPDAVVVASPTNDGYASAINAAMDAVTARGVAVDYWLILNDDIRLGTGSVRALKDAMVRDDRIGVTVPRLVDGTGQLLLSRRREPTILRAFGEALLGGDRAGWYPILGGVEQDPDAYGAYGDVTWASGCAWLVRDECWSEVGRWDESLFLYSEDVDYALRVRDAGLKMHFVPDAEVVHLVGPSHRDPRLWSMAMWNRFRLYRRRHGWLRSQVFRLGLLTNEVLRGVSGRSVHRAGAKALVSKSHRPPEVR